MADGLTPIDVFRFRQAMDPRISSDAARIAFVRIERDIATDRRISRILLSNDRTTWVVVDGGEGGDTPRWAPDSRHLAFLRKAGGQHEVVVVDTDGGGCRVIAGSDAVLRELAWSPDGKHLAWQAMVAADAPDWLHLPVKPEGAQWAVPRITERLIYRHDSQGDLEEGCFQVFVAAVEGGAPTRLTDGVWSSGFMHAPGLVWSGDRIILAASRREDWDRAPNELDLYAVGFPGGAVTRVTDMPGPEAMPTVCVDGLAFTAVERTGGSAPLRRLHFMPTGKASTVLLGDLDRSIDGVGWTTQGLVVSFDDEGGKVIARMRTDGQLTRLVRDVGGGNIEKPYSSGSFSAALDGTVVYTRSASDCPSEVALIAPDGTVSTLTDLNGELARERGFLRAESFWATSSLDGMKIQCWVLRPRGLSGPLPMIMEIHGGPFACYGDRFSITHQCFAAAGYAVLLVNPRGSIGYGAAFAQALHDKHPGPDWTDLMDGVDAAIARGGIDPERLHVAGTSGGGVLTLWSVTHSKRFRSAVSVKPVVNQESWVLTCDIGGYLGDLWFDGVWPWEDRQKYVERSPLAFVADVSTPTMLIAGERDSRTPISEAQQMYAALSIRGVPTALVSMPGVSHSTNAMPPSLYASEIAYTLDWFRRYK